MSMRVVWLPCALAAALLGACGFGAPKDGTSMDGAPGDGRGPDGTPPCADDDGDTVCNADDKCPGKDDRADADADGVPDGCDDWPCGAKPDDPGDPMLDAAPGRSWTASFITIGSSRRVVAAAGQPFNARFGWGIRINCPPTQTTCKAQVEIGYGATRTGCIYDGTVPDDQLLVNAFNAPITAPAAPGVYELRLNAGEWTSCGDSQQPWYGGDPGNESTIAIVCVP
jgi:hypothetical protein